MVVSRFSFGNTGLFGKPAPGQNRWIPSETGSWVPYQSEPMQLLLLGIAVGVPATWLADVLPGSIGITFGFVAFLLIFMQFGFKVPVTHHIALSASVLTATTGDMAWGIALVFWPPNWENFLPVFLFTMPIHISIPQQWLL